MSNSTSYNAVRGGSLAAIRQDINDKQVFTKFYGPYLYTDGVAGTASVSDAGINLLKTGDGETFQVRLEQAFAGSAPQALLSARGLHLVTDAASADGISMDLGYGAVGSETARCRGAFTIGTDGAFYLRVKLEVGDVSDASTVAVGFAKGGWPANGVLDAYTDYAALNIDGGDIKIQTNLNSGTQSSTDTTQNLADSNSGAETVELEVRVSAAGVVKFLVDGAAPTVDVTNYTFDDTDVVNAFVLILADVASPPTVILQEWESGYIASRGLTGTADTTEKARSTI